jgi:hypothetical protein
VLSILLDLQKRLAVIEEKLKLPDAINETPTQLSLTGKGDL